MHTIAALGGGDFGDAEMLPVVRRIVLRARTQKPKVLYMPTASYDDPGGFDSVRKLFGVFGCSCSMLRLTDEGLTEEQLRSAILGTDIVYCGGGNLEFMLSTFRSTHADKALTEAYESGTVMSGVSSGAMCWFGPSWDDCCPDGSFKLIDCLGIYPFSFCPHYERGFWSTYDDMIPTLDVSGIAAENGAALFVEDGVFSAVHGRDGGRVFLFPKEFGFAKTELL